MKFTRIPGLGLLLVLSPAAASAQGGISGTVYDSLITRAPLANATVVLVERSRYAATDARGHFRFDSVPDGRYTLSFLHPVLDSLGLQAPAGLVDVEGGRRVSVMLTTPSPAAAYALLCPGTRDTETGVIIGRVRDVDDQSLLANATVSTEWTEFTLSAGRLAGRRARAAARANPTGVFLLCGVPIQMTLEVRSELAGSIAGPTATLLDDRLIGHLDFAISRKDSAARDVLRGDSAAGAATSRGTASLRGVVRDGDGRPLRDALVGVFGTQQSVRSGSAGTFRIEGIPAGTRTIEARSIGWQPLTFSMDFRTNAARDTVVSLGRHAQFLQPVTVLGRGTSASADANGFETRRRQHFGTFITQEDLARHPAFDLIDVLAGVPGVHIEYGTGGFPTPLLHGTSGGFCRPNFFLDNMPFVVDSDFPFADLSAMVRPETIKGVEAYSSAGMIPPQYDRSSSTQCGSIIIWTH
jgi:hypothetical protein